MLNTHFTTEQITPLVIGSVLLVFSILTFKRNERLSLTLLFIGSIGMGYFMANLDPFLILWDEQYHALVAKNLSENFLEPTLYAEPVLDFNFKDWTRNHIWLHKQPLFLWQIAISIKLFGTSEFAVRLPSIVMHAIIPLFIYRIGKITSTKEVGFYGAILFSFAYFPLELIVGRYSTDHNDLAFLFYVTASFWAWFEYQNSSKKQWIILIGVLAGAAVLTKWLMGLLVFVLWLVSTIATEYRKGPFNKAYLPIISSGIISVIVFLPWQIYIHLKYPKEASYETALNAKHFFEPIEGHHETTWFYFTKGFNTLYGSGVLIPYILLLGLIFLIFKSKSPKSKVFIISAVVFVYSFYTLASTKMVSFPIIVSPFVFLGLGCLVYHTTQALTKKISNKALTQGISFFLLTAISFSVLNLSKIENYHTDWKPLDNFGRAKELQEIKFIQKLNTLLGEKHVIFNASITPNGHIPVMFYTNHIAYDFIPSPAQLEVLKGKQMLIGILDNGHLPSYIKSDPSIKIIQLID